MGIFRKKEKERIEFDFDKKTISIRELFTPSQIAGLMEKEWLLNDERVGKPPYKIVYCVEHEGKLDLVLLDGWEFHRKTIALYTQKDNRRYKNYRHADKNTIGNHYKRV